MNTEKLTKFLLKSNMPDDRYKNYRINIPREPAYSEWTDSPWLIENINDNYIYVDLGTSVSDSEQDIKRSIPAYIGAIVRLEKCNNIFAPDKPGYYILLDEGTQAEEHTSE